MNLYQIFRDRFEQHLERPFLITVSGHTHSYGEIDRLSAVFCAALQELGVAKGDRVVVQIDKSPGAIALYFACLRVGAIYVPLNTAYTNAEVSYFLEDASPALFICRPACLDGLAGIAAQTGVPHIHTLSETLDGTFAELAGPLQPVNELAKCRPDEVVAMLYTSGTTGRSKGAMLTLENLASNAKSLHKLWRFRPGDVLLHALPVFHVHGLFVALHCAMLNASSVLFLPRFDVDRVREMLPHATVLMGVPTFYTRLLGCAEFGRAECRHMRLFISGSAPLSDATFDAFEEKTGHRILERYGMTETGMITSNPLQGERLAGTVGHALPSVHVRVADEDGVELPAGATGMVELKGPNVFKGYWQMPEKTREAFREDGFFITGDMGSLDSDGRLTLSGRSGDLIISGGYNIYPKEIETVIDAVDGVTESAVIGVPDPDLGEHVLAIIVTDRSHTNIGQTILDAIGARLARFKQPRTMVFVDELPRNSMGKVQKNQLREHYAS